MNILVFPDLHQTRNLAAVERAIVREKPDYTVFLGDYFDQWRDTPEDAQRTAVWLKDSVGRADRVHLFGNHDLSYRYPLNRLTYCSGFSREKLAAINSVLEPQDWARLKLTHWEDLFLFSHAGWAREHAPVFGEAEPTAAFLREHLARMESEAWACIATGRRHWIWSVGMERGGLEKAGGILWCGADEFRPIPGIHQVFGHTSGTLARVWRDHGSVNLCCDTTDRFVGVAHYLVVEVPYCIHVKAIDGSIVTSVPVSTAPSAT